MRAIIFSLVATFASVASAQYPGGVEVLGPWQPSPYGGDYYFNPSAPPYRGPLALQPLYGYGFDDYATTRELRRIRWELEDQRLNRRYRR